MLGSYTVLHPVQTQAHQWDVSARKHAPWRLAAQLLQLAYALPVGAELLNISAKLHCQLSVLLKPYT
jgi:hypothetical protein